jgi:hypothetical protein
MEQRRLWVPHLPQARSSTEPDLQGASASAAPSDIASLDAPSAGASSPDTSLDVSAVVSAAESAVVLSTTEVSGDSVSGVEVSSIAESMSPVSRTAESTAVSSVTVGPPSSLLEQPRKATVKMVRRERFRAVIERADVYSDSRNVHAVKSKLFKRTDAPM